VRIATFNVLNGRSPADEWVDPVRFRAAIASLDADVLGLQEVDVNQPRSDRADLTALAAEAMGAVDHRFVAALAGTPASWSGASGDEAAGAPAYGVALLSRYAVRDWSVVRLPPAPVRLPYRFGGRVRPEWVRDEHRAAVLAELETPIGPMRVATTHLSFLPWWNGRQLRLLMGSLGAGAGPTVLTGDLNMRPGRAGRITGMTSLASGATFPADRPGVQLDHILCTEQLEGTGGPLALEISDHRALVVDLQVPGS
jgi:endonuclease/exonuclease/phosphatase family metal-dependent hydrolase